MAALGQSLSLWAGCGAIGAANSWMKDLEGIASLARRFCDCGQDLEEFCERFCATRQSLLLWIAPDAILRLINDPDRSFLRFYRLQV